ncbi:hypothetical protein BDC45DRAFT_499530 [Circinella umbellata]|nr:hypothetical protein BDC45DRAFT_499530 [Circinella umbellata]
MEDASIINHKRRMEIQAIAQNAENMACTIHNLANIIEDYKRKEVSELTEERKEKKMSLIDRARPQSAYDFFISENYDAIQNQFPNNDYNKKMKKLSDLWKKIPVKERKKYENLAELYKKQYDINCPKFKEGHEAHPCNSRKVGVTAINKKLQRKQQTVFHDDIIDELDSETSSNKESSAAIISSIPEIVVRKSNKNKNDRSGTLVVPTVTKKNNLIRKRQQQMGNNKYYDNEKKKRKLSKH